MGYPLQLVGEQHYANAVKALRRGDQVWLEHEPNNPHDPRAIRATDVHDRTLGYAPRESCIHRVVLDEGKEVTGFVAELRKANNGTRLDVLLEVEVRSPVERLGEPPSATGNDTTAPISKGCLLAIASFIALGLFAQMLASDPPPNVSAHNAESRR